MGDEQERTALYKEIFDMKLNQAIPETVAKLRREANPRLLLRGEARQDEMERAIVPEITGRAAPTAAPPTVPTSVPTSVPAPK